MQIIIPMAGESFRFKKAGFKKPKFLLKINNKLIIEHIIDLFPGEKNLIFICNKNHISNKKLKLISILKKKCPTGKIISIDPHKLGPGFSISKALDDLNDKEPIIINYCDFNSYWNYKKFKKFVKKKNYNGCVVVYKNFHPSTINNSYFAYIKEKDKNVIGIQEKKPFTKNPVNEYTSNGTYYFKNKDILENCLDKTFKNKLRVNGEYYVSMIYKPMIKEYKNVGFYKIDFFSQWGAPEDFIEYKKWSEKFEKIVNLKKKKIIKGLLVIPAAGKGDRFIKQGYKVHKPLIEISNKPMLVQAITTHPNHESLKVIISKKNGSSLTLKKKIKKYFPKTKIVSLKKHTNGQAITCLEAIKGENKEIPLTIGSCDTGIIFDQKKFFKIFNNSKTDVIVWATKNHSESIRNPKQFGWIKVNKSKINYVSVKKPLKDIHTDPIILGTFTYKKIDYFINSVNKMIKRKALVNNEFYIDTSINDAIALGYNCRIFLVEDFLPWGTPNELKTFKYWQEYFSLWKEHKYKINKPI